MAGAWRRSLAATLTSALAAVGAAAQVPQPVDPALPTRPQQPEAQPERPPQLPGSWRSQRVPDQLDPVWTDLPRTPFEGFPVFPSQLSGYGSYPTGPNEIRPGAPSLRPFPTLPMAAPEPPGWPAWARLDDREPLPYAVDLALLVRHSDRVWWRAADGDAYVPLYFHDKLRTLPVGAEVQVRQAGEFELLLHATTRVVAQGPTDLQLGALTETAVEIDVRRFTRLRVQVNGRDHLLRLPDGSRLLCAAAPDEGEAKGPALVLLTRADEPDRYGGRATIYNAGVRAVHWQHAFGSSRLEPGQRLTMFLRMPAAAIGAALVEQSARATPVGETVRFDGAPGGQVAWCGAQFDVGAGQRLALDPLQGEPFTAAKPAVGSAGPLR